MTLDTYLLFILGAFALIASPGPDFIYVLSRSIGQGTKSGLWAAAGVSTGTVIHTLFAVVGLTALLYSSAIAFLIVKYVGVCYLVYLGIRMFLNKNQFSNIGKIKPAPYYLIFRQGWLSNTLNPKVGLTFMAYMPQFLSPAESQPLVVLQFGLTISAIAMIWLVSVAVFSALFGKLIVENRSVGNIIRYSVSSLLIGFGFKLAFFERN